MSESHKPALGQRTCPTCGQPYQPTAAKYTYRPQPESREEGNGAPKLESVTYFGQCPNGHTVRETVGEPSE
jgi:hypothetical protein